MYTASSINPSNYSGSMDIGPLRTSENQLNTEGFDFLEKRSHPAIEIIDIVPFEYRSNIMADLGRLAEVKRSMASKGSENGPFAAQVHARGEINLAAERVSTPAELDAFLEAMNIAECEHALVTATPNTNKAEVAIRLAVEAKIRVLGKKANTEWSAKYQEMQYLTETYIKVLDGASIINTTVRMAEALDAMRKARDLRPTAHDDNRGKH